MNCKYCLKDLPEERPGGHRQREYCNDAHRQAYWRQQHQTDQLTALLTELEALRTTVSDQAQRIEKLKRRIADLEHQLSEKVTTVDDQAQRVDELTAENTLLKSRLDIERRYLADTGPHFFKTWLKKQRVQTTMGNKLIKDATVRTVGSRGYYEAHVRRLCTDEEEQADFTRLWKLMLLQS